MELGVKPRRRLLAVAVTLGIIALAAVAGWLLERNIRAREAKAELDTQIRLARAEGIPLTLAELAPNPPVTDAENAAPYFLKAIEAARPYDQAIKDLESNMPLTGKNPALEAKFNRSYARLRPAIADVAKACTYPKCDFHDKYGPDPLDEATMERTFSIVHVVWMVRSQALGLSRDGHPLQGLRLLRSVASSASLLVDCRNGLESLLLDSFPSNAVGDAVGDILAAHGREAGVPEAAESTLHAMAEEPDVERVIIGDSILDVASLAEIRKASSPSLKAVPRELAALAHAPGTIDRWKTVRLEITREVLERARRDRGDLPKLGKDYEVIVTNYTSRPGDAYANLRFDRDMFPRGYPVNPARILAAVVFERRLLTHAARVFEIWNRTGHLPESLEASPSDPLTAGAFEFSRTVDGFRIYSHGRSSTSVSQRGDDFAFPDHAKGTPSPPPNQVSHIPNRQKT